MTPCFECEAEAVTGHHVIPRSLGGTKTVPLCARCHAKVHGLRAVWTPTLTAAALKAKRARGEKTGGDVPFGYRLAEDGRTLVEDAEGQRVIALVRDLRANGWTRRAIGAELEGRGVLTKRGGTHWHPETVKSLL